MTAAPILEARGLRKSYAGHRTAFGAVSATVTAVRDVSFRLAPGDPPLAVVGESGSGKSTLARLLAGLESPDSGQVLIRGVPRQRGRRKTGRLAAAREVQLVFQDPYLSLDPRIPVGRCLDEVLKLHSGRPARWRGERIAELLDAVGLRCDAAQLPRRLSGGERQRVAIARALAVEPLVLVLDEAVSSLDVSTGWRILRLLAGLRERLGLCYVFVTHDLGVARYLAGRVLVMRAGEVVEEGPTQAVLSAPRDPYTRLLVDSIPRPGWEPERVLERRAAPPAATEAQVGVPAAGRPA